MSASCRIAVVFVINFILWVGIAAATHAIWRMSR